MGLDTTHGCWHGAYGAFHRWPDGDGGGRIGNWRETTQQFADGCRLAATSGEPVEFH